MTNSTADLLTTLERENQVRILFAADAGHAGLGIPAPRPSQDVRFVFVHSLDWYLSLNPRSDVIQERKGKGFSCSGWDLPRALTLFAECHLGFNEWIGSAAVFKEDQNFTKRLRKLIPSTFNPRKAARHYISRARSAMRAHPPQRKAQPHQLLESARLLLACEWIARERSMPPTALSALLDAELVEESVDRELRGLLEDLSGGESAEPAQQSSELAHWMQQAYDLAEANAPRLPSGSNVDWQALNALYHDMVMADDQ